jgi:phage head maturation protease
LSLDRFGAQLEIKSVDQRIITGFAAAGGLDRVGDVIDMSVAFRKTLSQKPPSDVAVFIGHDTSALPVGIPISIEATPQGLKTETRVFEGPAGDNLLAVARGLHAAGQALGLSIGYRVTDSRPDRVNGKSVRLLTGIDLVEYSFAARQSIANPRALTTGVKAGDGMGDYTVEQRGDKFHAVRKSDGQSMGSYDTEAAAKAACEMHAGGGKTALTAADINDLPDSAFLHVEAGGVLDDEGKTVPRANRHFRFRDAAGALDAEALAAAMTRIPEAKTIGLDRTDAVRMATRVRILLETGQDWKTGSPLDIRSFGYRLLDLSDQLANEHKAMTLLGESTKDGLRIRAGMRQKIAAVAADITTALTWAETIDKGEDGVARLALLARELELLEV